MRFRFSPPRWLAGLFFLLTTCLPWSRVTGEESPDAAKPPVSPGTPAMVWRLDGGKAPVYLAGSIHLLKPENYPLPEPYERAWKASKHIVMEIVPGEMEKPETVRKMLKLSMLPEGKLEDRVAPGTWDRLAAWGREAGVPEIALQRMTPWMAALTVAMKSFEKLGYRQDLGLEDHFAELLKREPGKTVAGLETAEYQLGLFTGLTPKQQEDMLLQALSEAADLNKFDARLTAAWAKGDADALHRLMHENFKDFPEIERLLINKRNEAWIEPILKLLSGDKPAMVIVGAGHLAGPDSVIALLQKRGVKVEQLRAER